MPAKPWCVIYNPAAGKRRAEKRLASLRETWHARADFRPSLHPGHAVGLGRQAALEGYEVVVAAGGDGTVHDVANGILLSQNSHTRFGVLPIGSANDYAYSLEKAFPPSGRVDVGFIRDPSGREKFFLCNMGLGLNGMVTWESRRIRWLQGVALYGLATLRALWFHYQTPTLDLGIDARPTEAIPTLMLSLLIGHREGGFVMAPQAKLDDGLFDYVLATDLSRWEVMRFLPRLALAGPPQDHPKVRLGQCRRISLRSPAPLAIHLDGEFFATPDDNVCSIEVEIRPGALAVDKLEF